MMRLYHIWTPPPPPSPFTLNVYEGFSGSTTLVYRVVFGSATPFKMVGYNIYMEYLVYCDPNLWFQIIQWITINLKLVFLRIPLFWEETNSVKLNYLNRPYIFIRLYNRLCLNLVMFLLGILLLLFYIGDLRPDAPLTSYSQFCTVFI